MADMERKTQDGTQGNTKLVEEKNQQKKQNEWPEVEGETVIWKLTGKRFSKQGVISNLNYYTKVKKQ